jgi:hypothetical protein
VEYLCIGLWPLCHAKAAFSLAVFVVSSNLLNPDAAPRTCSSVIAIESCRYNWTPISQGIPGTILLIRLSSSLKVFVGQELSLEYLEIGANNKVFVDS